MDTEPNNIIACREYVLTLPDGAIVPVSITLEKPRMLADRGGDWYCKVIVKHPDYGRSFEIGGGDSVCALLMALGASQLEAEHLMAVHGRSISYIEPGFHDLWPFFKITHDAENVRRIAGPSD
jgi:hypothetical protein